MHDVPLFPLPLVLLPGTVELLHIFEPRYRRMLADVLEGNRTFGLIHCPSGTSESDLPRGTVGCLAMVEHLQPLPDGRSNIAIRGTSRFRFVAYRADAARPYRMAVIEPLGDAPPGAAPAPRLEELFARHQRAARRLMDDRSPPPELPTALDARVYAMAQAVDLPLDERQALLTLDAPDARTARLVAWLEHAVPATEAGAARHERAHTNGHGGA